MSIFGYGYEPEELQSQHPMNTDFVPLSSLLESMKAPSFEGLSTESGSSSQKEKPKVPDQNTKPSLAPAEKPKEPAPTPAPAPEPSPSPEPKHECKEPKILLDREGDKISRIRVLCSCGQSIVLDCNY